MPEYGLDSAFVKRYVLLHHQVLGLKNAEMRLNTLLLSTLIVVSGLEQILAYYVGMMSGAFYEILSQIDLDAFKSELIRATLLIALMTVVKSLRAFVSRTLGVAMRSALVSSLHASYFAKFNVYHINKSNNDDNNLDNEQNVDNADQRLTSDTRNWSDLYIRLMSELCLVPIVALYYVYAVYIRTSFTGPLMVLTLFLVSSVINKRLMAPIVNLSVNCESKEGDLRYKHASLRLQNESLAFQTPLAINERFKSDRLASNLFSIYQKLFNKQLILELATNAFDYLGVIVSFIVVAIPIFKGDYNHLTQAQRARIVSENAFVCIYLVYQLSKIVDMSPTISNFAALTHRVGELLQAMHREQKRQHEEITEQGLLEEQHISVVFREDPIGHKGEEEEVLLYIRNLNVVIPRINSVTNLVSQLNLSVKRGSNMLIMGSSSSGKTSLLRVIRGLWPPQGENYDLKVYSKAFFLPQKTFLTTGSLREQIVYPLQVSKELKMSKEQYDWMTIMLKNFKMDSLLSRCGENLDFQPDFDWIQTMSAGELQRLAFIRMFFHRPKVAFLDEATSALDVAIEAQLYNVCIDLGITVVSVGHRESLKQFHQRLLYLHGDGRWDLSDI